MIISDLNNHYWTDFFIGLNDKLDEKTENPLELLTPESIKTINLISVEIAQKNIKVQKSVLY